MRTALLALAIATAATNASADQCAWISRDVANKAKSFMTRGLSYIEYCKPCGDRKPSAPSGTLGDVSVSRAGSPGTFEVKVKGKGIDLAYFYVQRTAGGAYENVAGLAGCPATGVPRDIRLGATAPTTQSGGSTGTVQVACSFKSGWVSVLPKATYKPREKFQMQALIGLAEAPSMWKMPEYRYLQPYAAKKCTAGGVDFKLAPGQYMVMVGWANRFQVMGEYKNNGFLKEITVAAGGSEKIALEPRKLTHTWLCISCPYLEVFLGGRFVDVGQVLVDRYAANLRGTDVRRVKLDVAGGVVRIRIREREPEITHLAAVEVRAGGKRLVPLDAPAAARTLRMGESVELTFQAPVESGQIEADVHVTGHYERLGSL